MAKRFIPVFVRRLWTLILLIPNEPSVYQWIRHDMNAVPPDSLFWWTLAVSLVLTGWLTYRELKHELIYSHPTTGLNDISPILQQMDARLMELAKSESKRCFNPLRYIEINTQANELFFDMAKFQRDPNEKLTSRKQVRERAKEIMTQMESKIEPIAKQILGDFDTLLADMKEKNSFFNLHNYGLKPRRERDYVYKNLNSALSISRSIVSDDSLNEMIRDHIECSESFGNFILIKERGVKLFRWFNFFFRINPIELMSTKNQRGIDQLEHNLNEFMSSIRVAINQRVKELESENKDGAK